MTATSVPVASRGRTALVVGGAVIVAAIASALVALLAGALGADPTFGPLQPGAYLSFTIAGTLLAIGGWVLVVRVVRRSARVLRILVPLLVVLSLIPDVLVLVSGVIPGTNVPGVVALMIMHLVVAGVAVLAGRMIAPPR